MKQPLNILLIGVDSLAARHMSCYGYKHLTTPHLDNLASQGVLFERNFCPHVPTTSGYGTMLTGLDCFSNSLVALRHEGGMPAGVKTLAEVLGENGYATTCVGFEGNIAARGFQKYTNFSGWGNWQERPALKAENLNAVALPELTRLAEGDQPWLLFLRHMDPHSPYLPPAPFERMFYGGNELDPNNHSLDEMWDFKPFRDYFATWMPPGCTDAEYVIAQYDGAVAYMDASIQAILTQLETMGLAENTLVILNADHGETLADHDCYFDHHGIYDCTLHVPLILRLPGQLPAGRRVTGMTLHQDLMPTVLEMAGIKSDAPCDGQSLLPLVEGKKTGNYDGFYITECTWMRKHGWRTEEWKLIHALEPDFHYKPEVELYNLKNDPDENVNLADQEPAVRDELEARLQAWVAKREAETGRPNPMYTNLNWHGVKEHPGPFVSSDDAYNSLHIGDANAAAKLQDRKAK